MKIIKKYIEFTGGFIRFKKFEINWSLYEWALPLSIDFGDNYLFIRILCICIIFNLGTT